MCWVWAKWVLQKLLEEQMENCRQFLWKVELNLVFWRTWWIMVQTLRNKAATECMKTLFAHTKKVPSFSNDAHAVTVLWCVGNNFTVLGSIRANCKCSVLCQYFAYPLEESTKQKTKKKKNLRPNSGFFFRTMLGHIWLLYYRNWKKKNPSTYPWEALWNTRNAAAAA